MKNSHEGTIEQATERHVISYMQEHPLATAQEISNYLLTIYEDPQTRSRHTLPPLSNSSQRRGSSSSQRAAGARSPRAARARPPSTVRVRHPLAAGPTNPHHNASHPSSIIEKINDLSTAMQSKANKLDAQLNGRISSKIQEHIHGLLSIAQMLSF
eukprot:192489-Rhodomonas_salina.1